LFDGDPLYTWNIDGKLEHEVLSILQEMTMVMEAYKARGLTNRQSAIGIIQGF